MVLVLDPSIILPRAFSDEQTAAADAVVDRLATEDAIVPALWWFKARNAPLAGERRGRLDAARTTAFLQRLAGLPVQIDRSSDEAVLLALARRHRLTVYVEAHLELAVGRWQKQYRVCTP